MIKLPTSIKGRVAAALLTLSMAGAGAIVAHEGMRRVAYVDPVGVVTVCAGHTSTAKLGQVKTEAECAELLKQDAAYAASAVKRLVKVPLTQPQFDALVSFVFNVGEGNFAKSTMLKKINQFDCYGAGAEFMRWTYAGGRELPGLVIRRQSERQEWEKGCAKGNYKTGSIRGSLSFDTAWAQARRPHPGSLELLVWQVKR
jgi:lysozyme